MYRNIGACKEFGQTLRTAYGPQGRNKMIINHIEKLFVTNDAATIIKELEVRKLLLQQCVHPTVKIYYVNYFHILKIDMILMIYFLSFPFNKEEISLDNILSYN